MEMGGRHIESREDHRAESLSKNEYSPFERSPAPEIPSPRAEIRVENQGRHHNAMEKSWPGPRLRGHFAGVGGSGSGNGSGSKEDELEDGPCEGEEEMQHMTYTHQETGDEDSWTGNAEGMDIARDPAMQEQEDEYEYYFEPELEYEGEDREDLFGKEGDEAVIDEEVDYLDSE
ncbi:hypothetical protein VTL71DRAFT_15618 [Oculimacula yallundae]|uniref:Uncharacterized protein n=1 Tax=Oculimacula yallundae TaxID=86028 RepID=A0ABR4CHU9_9HELO